MYHYRDPFPHSLLSTRQFKVLQFPPKTLHRGALVITYTSFGFFIIVIV